jgi:arsenite methyltransferase
MASPTETKIAVKDNYGAIASADLSQVKATEVAKAFGYSHEELAQLPDGANMGLSCGNPTALASLKPGETVLDLGSGGGIDCFLASKKVLSTGKVIGVDMTQPMIEKARKNAINGGYSNVEFRLGEIENLPVDSNSVDCIISNCVINLVPNKQRAYDECFRVLKPGGRFAFTDIAFKKQLPEPFASNLKFWAGCIAGAQPADEMRRMLQGSGFNEIDIIDSKSDLNVYKGQQKATEQCCGPSKQKAAGGCCGSSTPSPSASACAVLLPGSEHLDFNEYAMSVKVFALKPKST